MKRAVTTGVFMTYALLCNAAAAHAGVAKPAVEWHDRAAAAAVLLDRQWGTGQGWIASENWQRFPIADALIDYQRRTGDRRWASKIATAVRQRSGLYLNDDDLWAVIASVHAWQTDHDPELLGWATENYSRIVTGFWDGHCSGGVWWDHSRSYKNAITNELLLYASTQLYLATGQEPYRAWALRSWSWFAASTMIGKDGLVNDGLDSQCRNNGAPRFTYNQGVLLGGLSDLSTITKDPRYREIAVTTALAATRTLVDERGLLTEPSAELGRDGPMFKGVFAHHLGHLIEAMPEGAERTELLTWARRNGEEVWRQSKEGEMPIDGLWSGGSDQPGAAAQASGLEILLAASS
jgi:predicted alpha-1,6-mannanase (GH76 family)